MISYFNIPVVLEWITLIASLFLLDKKTGYWRMFIPYLVLTICGEAMGWMMYHLLKIKYNGLPYNISMLVGKSFLIYFFSKNAYLTDLRARMVLTAQIFLLLGAGNLLFLQGISFYNSYSDAAGSISLAVISCIFLFRVVKAPEYIDLITYDYFWLTMGILIYSMGSTLLYHFEVLFQGFYEDTGINIANYINYALNLILFGSLIIAFVCRRKATR